MGWNRIREGHGTGMGGELINDRQAFAFELALTLCISCQFVKLLNNPLLPLQVVAES